MGRNLLSALIFLAAVSAITGLGLLAAAPKNVDYYYLSHGRGGMTNANCVYAHWTWHMDELAFCTDDSQKALDFVGKANATIVKGATK